MFTGLVKGLGRIEQIDKNSTGMTIKVTCKEMAQSISVDDSVSIDGVCQTAILVNDTSFTVNVVNSTLQKTNFKKLYKNKLVNLELALRIGDRLGGHIVQGHVNTTGILKSIINYGESYKVAIDYSNTEFNLRLVKEGSICINGVSLTICDVNTAETTFNVFVIPHTWENTTFRSLSIGDELNLEFDVIGQYVVNYMESQNSSEKRNNSLEAFLRS